MPENRLCINIHKTLSGDSAEVYLNSLPQKRKVHILPPEAIDCFSFFLFFSIRSYFVGQAVYAVWRRIYRGRSKERVSPTAGPGSAAELQ